MSRDACTFFIEGSWHGCCEEHDDDYAKGGDPAARRRSDRRLRKCIKNRPSWKVKGIELKKLLPIVSRIVWLGVRVGGASRFWPWINWRKGARVGRPDR